MTSKFARGASPRTTRAVVPMVAAVAGYLAIPNFFDHYALPMLPPLAVSAATVGGLASQLRKAARSPCTQKPPAEVAGGFWWF